MRTAELYQLFADREARGSSPSYERLARAVAEDPGVLALLDALPPAKRQPNLLFGAVRFLDGPLGGYAGLRDWLTGRWPEVRATMLARSTQTNEPRRMATLLPLLATLPGPLALLEVGASAGLCLYPDRWRHAYPHGSVGAADLPTLSCAADRATPVPGRLPEVVWRAGLDLNPLDVTDAGDVSWLRALVWPEHGERQLLLDRAAELARAEPPHLVRGDLLHDLPALVDQAPADATLVVFHSAVLAYVDPAERARFVAQVRARPGTRWISNEGPRVLPEVGSRVPGAEPEQRFLLALDGRPVAWTHPHGRAMEWLAC